MRFICHFSLFARANRLHLVFALSTASAIGMLHWGNVSVDLPVGDSPLPLTFCLPLTLAMFHGLSLIDWWPSFTPSAVRPGFLFRLSIGIVSSAIAVGLSSFGLLTEFGPSVVSNSMLLVAVTQISVVLLGERYWSATIATGLIVFTFQLSIGASGLEYRAFMAGNYGLASCTVLLFASLTLFSLAGPRGRGRLVGDEI